MKKWNICTQSYIFSKPWLTVRKDTLELANGKTIPEYYVLEYPDIATVIAITKDKKFVFVEQYRHGIQEITTELCGGTCQPNETPLETAKRELLEETGYANGEWCENMKLAVHPIALNNYTYNFIAENVELTNKQKLDEAEDISIHLYSEMEVWSMLCHNKIIQPTQAAALWKYFSTKKSPTLF